LSARVLQVEQTKVTKNSNDIFLIVQGNENTSVEYVAQTAIDAGNLITKYLGGRSRY